MKKVKVLSGQGVAEMNQSFLFADEINTLIDEVTELKKKLYEILQS